MNGEKCTAIVLAAGKGSRMGTKIQKQYLEICGKPVLYYSLAAFEASPVIDEIVLVTGEGQIDYCRENIVEAYGILKVSKIVVGGKERYESVYKALREIEPEGYVFIHDGARPFVDEPIIERTYQAVKKYRACVAGMPSKDTVKIVDEKGFAINIPKDIIERVYFAGVKKENEKLLTNGGRVLGITNIADTLDKAIKRSYEDAKQISFEGAYYRKDIGKKALLKKGNN